MSPSAKELLSLIKTFVLNLQFIFKPNWWVMNHPYSPEMDRLMNELLDKHDFEQIGEFTAYLGGHKIWISNKPYCCMVLESYVDKCRPSRLTILKGLRKLKPKPRVANFIEAEIKNIPR